MYRAIHQGVATQSGGMDRRPKMLREFVSGHTKIAEITKTPKTTVAGWCSGTKVRDYPDVVKKFREGLSKAGYHEALEDFNDLYAAPTLPLSRSNVMLPVEKARLQSQLAIYSELEGREDRLRVTGEARSAYSIHLSRTGEGRATYESDNDKFRNVTMPAYRRMAELLAGEHRALLESSTLALATNFFKFRSVSQKSIPWTRSIMHHLLAPIV